MQNLVEVFETLKKDVRSNRLTPAKKVTFFTLIGVIENWGKTKVYAQYYFEDLPMHLKHDLIHRGKGDVVGPYKVVAIFDVWE